MASVCYTTHMPICAECKKEFTKSVEWQKFCKRMCGQVSYTREYRIRVRKARAQENIGPKGKMKVVSEFGLKPPPRPV